MRGPGPALFAESSLSCESSVFPLTLTLALSPTVGVVEVGDVFSWGRGDLCVFPAKDGTTNGPPRSGAPTLPEGG